MVKYIKQNNQKYSDVKVFEKISVKHTRCTQKKSIKEFFYSIKKINLQSDFKVKRKKKTTMNAHEEY